METGLPLAWDDPKDCASEGAPARCSGVAGLQEGAHPVRSEAQDLTAVEGLPGDVEATRDSQRVQEQAPEYYSPLANPVSRPLARSQGSAIPVPKWAENDPVPATVGLPASGMPGLSLGECGIPGASPGGPLHSSSGNSMFTATSSVGAIPELEHPSGAPAELIPWRSRSQSGSLSASQSPLESPQPGRSRRGRGKGKQSLSTTQALAPTSGASLLWASHAARAPKGTSALMPATVGAPSLEQAPGGAPGPFEVPFGVSPPHSLGPSPCSASGTPGAASSTARGQAWAETMGPLPDTKGSVSAGMEAAGLESPPEALGMETTEGTPGVPGSSPGASLEGAWAEGIDTVAERQAKRRKMGQGRVLPWTGESSAGAGARGAGPALVSPGHTTAWGLERQASGYLHDVPRLKQEGYKHSLGAEALLRGPSLGLLQSQTSEGRAHSVHKGHDPPIGGEPLATAHLERQGGGPKAPAQAHLGSPMGLPSIQQLLCALQLQLQQQQAHQRAQQRTRQQQQAREQQRATQQHPQDVPQPQTQEQMGCSQRPTSLSVLEEHMVALAAEAQEAELLHPMGYSLREQQQQLRGPESAASSLDLSKGPHFGDSGLADDGAGYLQPLGRQLGDPVAAFSGAGAGQGPVQGQQGMAASTILQDPPGASQQPQGSADRERQRLLQFLLMHRQRLHADQQLQQQQQQQSSPQHQLSALLGAQQPQILSPKVCAQRGPSPCVQRQEGVAVQEQEVSSLEEQFLVQRLWDIEQLQLLLEAEKQRVVGEISRVRRR